MYRLVVILVLILRHCEDDGELCLCGLEARAPRGWRLVTNSLVMPTKNKLFLGS